MPPTRDDFRLLPECERRGEHALEHALLDRMSLVILEQAAKYKKKKTGN